MSRPLRPALLASLVALTGCDGADRSHPPVRVSPELEVIDDASATRDMVVDAMRVEATWLERSTGDVWRFRGGRAERIHEGVPVPELGDVTLRVFDDQSAVVASPDALHLVAPSGESRTIAQNAIELAIDGTSIDDLWVLRWLPGGVFDLCHLTPDAEVCTPVPNVGGYTALVGLAADGSVYVNDRDVTLYRFADGALTTVEGLDGAYAHTMRRSGDTLFVQTDGGLFSLEGGRAVRRGSGGYIGGIVGSPEDRFELHYDSEWVKVDPSCRDGWFTDCEHRLLWSEMLVVRVRDGREEEIAHETCDDAHPEVCERGPSWNLALDGDDVIVVGAPLRVARGGGAR